MAYKSCAAKIAASIQQDCNKPLVGGYTGRAVILSVLDFERAEVVRSATNPRKILSIVLPPDGSVMAYTVDNVFAQPFTGSTTAGNNENGRNGYLKTVSVRVPMRGADTSMQVIEPLVKDPNGFVMILEKRDKVGDGSYEVIGYQNALRGDIAGVTRDESANGGDWIVPLTTVEKWAEVTLVGADETYESAKKEFEGLSSFVPKKMTFTVSNNIAQKILITGSAPIILYIDGVKTSQYNIAPDTIQLVDVEGTLFEVYGDVISIDGDTKKDDTHSIVSLDVSAMPTIEEIDLSTSRQLSSLNIANTQNLLELTLPDNYGVDYEYLLSSIYLAKAGDNALSYFEEWMQDGYLPTSGILYVDENTPQSIINYFESNFSEWDIIYVNV